MAINDRSQKLFLIFAISTHLRVQLLRFDPGYQNFISKRHHPGDLYYTETSSDISPSDDFWRLWFSSHDYKATYENFVL